ITLSIDPEKKIADAKFKAIGCQVLVASASFLTEEIKRKTTADAARVAQPKGYSEIRLGAGLVPPFRAQCVALCRVALLSAITQYSDVMREEWIGEEALICSCFGVSESEIEKEIELSSLQTI